MFCRACGTRNEDRATQCVSCGAPLLPAPPVKAIDNHLVLAIIVTVLCCLPFGIVGIVYAAQVNPKLLGGDVGGAQESARKAKLWTYWGLGTGAALYIIYIALILAGVVLPRVDR